MAGKITAQELESKLLSTISGKIDSASIINDLVSGGSTKVLSAEQGKILNSLLKDIENKNFGEGHSKLCTDAYLIIDDYAGFTGVIHDQTSHLPEGFDVGIRHQLTYDQNNHIVTLYDTQIFKKWVAFYNGTGWTDWICDIDNRGGVFKDKITVKKDDGYVEVEDNAGRRLAMHTNTGIGWIHLFNSDNAVVNDLTLNPDGSITSRGTSITKIPCCKVYHPSNQVVPGSDTKNTLAWDNILFTSHEGMCANVGTSANIVVPETGIYQFDATVNFTTDAGKVHVYLSKNNAETIDAKLMNSNGGMNSHHLSGMYPMTKGDYVQVHFYYSGATSATVLNSSRFQAFLVRGKI